MKELLLKYKNNTITHEEFLRLRQMVDNCSDEELSSLLLTDWLEDEDSSYHITDEDIRRIKESIDAEREDKSVIGMLMANSRRVILRIAAVLLPLFVLSTLYYYNKNSETGQTMVSVVTADGEKTSIILPDSTRVMLNSNSQLSYCAADFAGNTRSVRFSGEAFFDVRKDAKAPFLVNGSDFSVKVLGTKFNVNAYENSNNVTVALEAGSVRFAAGADKFVVMNPGEKTIYDRIKGSMTTTNMEKINENSAWCQNELVFYHASFSLLVERMQATYGVHISVKPESQSFNETFTGVLPTNNLTEALDIIEELYHVSTTISGRNITIQRK